MGNVCANQRNDVAIEGVGDYLDACLWPSTNEPPCEKAIQKKMHEVRMARLAQEHKNVAAATQAAEVKVEILPEQASLAGRALSWVSGRLWTAAEEKPAAVISVEPTATLPTVQKIYAPNVYPFPPIAGAPLHVAKAKPTASKPAADEKPGRILSAISWVSGRLFGAAEPQVISVEPSATLPTVQKNYAPNVYPFPPMPKTAAAA